jgi:hypothetical protein
VLAWSKGNESEHPSSLFSHQQSVPVGHRAEVLAPLRSQRRGRSASQEAGWQQPGVGDDPATTRDLADRLDVIEPSLPDHQVHPGGGVLGLAE